MEWISVNDRLPLEINPDDIYIDIEVLVTDGERVAIVPFATGSVGENWRDWSSYGEISPSMITHWMPLPPAPQGE